MPRTPQFKQVRNGKWLFIGIPVRGALKLPRNYLLHKAAPIREKWEENPVHDFIKLKE